MLNQHRRKDDEGRCITNYYLGKGIDFTFAENDYDKVDFTGVSKKKCNVSYAGDIKCYNDKNHARYSYKYDDYQVDYDKLREIKKKALNNNSTPLLIVLFTDKLVVWDLDKTDWETTATWVKVNKDGCNYGEKEWELQAHLNIGEAIYNKDRRRDEEPNDYN